MHAYMIACLFGLTHSSGCQNEYLNITLGLYWEINAENWSWTKWVHVNVYTCALYINENNGWNINPCTPYMDYAIWNIHVMLMILLHLFYLAFPPTLSLFIFLLLIHFSFLFDIILCLYIIYYIFVKMVKIINYY